MKTILALAALALSAGFVSVAHADDISLGEPGYGGTGCPGGSVSTTLSPDAKSLSLLFDAYSAQAGGDTGKAFDRKSCNIAIPVHVPQGLSISVLAIDYRGYNNVPAGAKSEFNVEYFFAGAKGPSFKKTFYGPQGRRLPDPQRTGRSGVGLVGLRRGCEPAHQFIHQGHHQEQQGCAGNRRLART